MEHTWVICSLGQYSMQMTSVWYRTSVLAFRKCWIFATTVELHGIYLYPRVAHCAYLINEWIWIRWRSGACNTNYATWVRSESLQNTAASSVHRNGPARTPFTRWFMCCCHSVLLTLTLYVYAPTVWHAITRGRVSCRLFAARSNELLTQTFSVIYISNKFYHRIKRL